MGKFEQQYTYGMVAESAIAKWLLNKGWCVQPVYEIEIHSGKGPRLFTQDGEFVLPDMLTIKDSNIYWVEAKHKTHFTWYRQTNTWQTGVDLHHFKHYCRVAEITKIPVFLLFLHREHIPSQEDLINKCPAECPVGLFGKRLDYLINEVDHESLKHGSTGMVYWDYKTLSLIAPLEDLL